MFSDNQHFDDESYLMEGLHITNAIPYGYQVFVEGIFQHPEHKNIRIRMDQEFFTTEVFSTKHNYYSDTESIHYVEKISNRGVQLTLNEDNARAFFHAHTPSASPPPRQGDYRRRAGNHPVGNHHFAVLTCKTPAPGQVFSVAPYFYLCYTIFIYPPFSFAQEVPT